MELDNEPLEIIENFKNKFKLLSSKPLINTPNQRSIVTMPDSVKDSADRICNSQQIVKSENTGSTSPLERTLVLNRASKMNRSLLKTTKALKRMAKGGSKESAEAMIALLRKGGWRRSENLPEGWMSRKRTVQRSRNGNYILSTFLSPQFDFFNSHSKVLAFLKESGVDEEVLKKATEDQHFGRNSRGRSENIGKDAFDWQEDETLPSGWKVAYYKPSLGSMKVAFMFSLVIFF